MDRRIAIVSNEPYHIYNRGNNRQTIFRTGSDYEAFLNKLEATGAKHSVLVAAYVLMPNHFHLLVIQRTGGSVPDMMEALGTSTAKRFNIKYEHVGHLFQGPYRSTPVMTMEGVAEVARYIHLNPVRAHLVSSPEDWEWSDFHHHVKEVRGNLLPRNYVDFVRQGVADIEAVRRLLFADQSTREQC